MNTGEKIAVIDIGSNSCRMVIYERSGAALIPYFNEKAMAGLGRDLSETGRLSPSGQELALKTFHRFRAITASLNIRDIRAVATAAVREADDGPDFKARAERILCGSIKTLSGADEGRRSARGVAAGFVKPAGLIADLGGTSMEIRPVQGKAKGDNVLDDDRGRVEHHIAQRIPVELVPPHLAYIVEPIELLPVHSREVPV